MITHNKDRSANGIIAKVNAVEGLSATLEIADNGATPEHIGLVRIEVDSSAPQFHSAIKRDTVGDVIDAALSGIGVNGALTFVDADESASTAWYRITY